MPAKRGLTMRQMRQMLRLLHDGVSARDAEPPRAAFRQLAAGWLRHASFSGLAKI
jgi:hypothetical protein